MTESTFRAHVTDGSPCWCQPSTQEVQCGDGTIGRVIVHNSEDGREHREPDHDRAACPTCTAAEDA